MVHGPVHILTFCRESQWHACAQGCSRGIWAGFILVLGCSRGVWAGFKVLVGILPILTRWGCNIPQCPISEHSRQCILYKPWDLHSQQTIIYIYIYILYIILSAEACCSSTVRWSSLSHLGNKVAEAAVRVSASRWLHELWPSVAASMRISNAHQWFCRAQDIIPFYCQDL